MVASPLSFQVPQSQGIGGLDVSASRAAAGLSARGATPEKVLSGRVILGDQRGSTAVEVERIRLGRRGLVFQFPWSLEAGRHAWVELTLPTGKRIRPLVCVLQTTEAGVSARFVHLFPEHRRALDAALTSPSGY